MTATGIMAAVAEAVEAEAGPSDLLKALHGEFERRKVMLAFESLARDDGGVGARSPGRG